MASPPNSDSCSPPAVCASRRWKAVSSSLNRVGVRDGCRILTTSRWKSLRSCAAAVADAADAEARSTAIRTPSRSSSLMGSRLSRTNRRSVLMLSEPVRCNNRVPSGDGSLETRPMALRVSSARVTLWRLVPSSVASSLAVGAWAPGCGLARRIHFATADVDSRGEETLGIRVASPGAVGMVAPHVGVSVSRFDSCPF